MYLHCQTNLIKTFRMLFPNEFMYEGMTVGHLVGDLLSSFIVATVIGLAAGIGWAFVLKQVRELKHSMILTPSIVVHCLRIDRLPRIFRPCGGARVRARARKP